MELAVQPSTHMYVFDIDLNRTEAHNLLNKIREIDENQQQRRPLLVMNSTSSDEMLQSCETYSIDEMLVKPVAQEKLVEAVRRIKGQRV